MSIRLQKPWQLLNAANLTRIEGQLGVYQIGNCEQQVIYIGYSGGRSLFGLRGDLTGWLQQHHGENLYFRHEVNMQYMSRHEELLMIHAAEFGELPAQNQLERKNRLGRLSPA